MPRQAGISAKISGDAKPLKAALDASLKDTQAWVNKIVGINAQAQRSYNSLAFSGPTARGKSPIQMLADEDARAWARRMSDTDRRSRAWGRNLKANTGDALLQVAQAADDAQYGLRGVINNIPGIVQSLGGKAGIAGTLAAIAIIWVQLQKAGWDKILGRDKIDEAKNALEKLNEKLKQVEATGAKESLEGTAAAAAALAEAVRTVESAFSESLAAMSQTAALQKELFSAQANLVAARGSNDPVAGVVATSEAQMDAAEKAHKATVDQWHAERAAYSDRAAALAKFADEQEAAAAEARATADAVGMDAGADPFLKRSARNRADAAEVDAAKAREAANEADRVSVREQARLGREIMNARKVHELEMEAMRIRAAKEVEKAEQEVLEKAEQQSKAQIEAAKAADEKRKSEAASAELQRKRTLEAEREAILQIKINRAKAEGNQEEVRRLEKERAFQNNRDRLIDAGMDPARASRAARQIVDSEDEASGGRGRRRRRSFGVDDVKRYQRGSLRGDLDAYIGPIGNGGRWDSGAERRAHTQQTRSVQAAAEDRQLAEIAKSLKAIEQNTEGLQKTKSEPLRRS